MLSPLMEIMPVAFVRWLALRYGERFNIGPIQMIEARPGVFVAVKLDRKGEEG